MRGDSLDLLVSHRVARPYQSSPGKAHSWYLQTFGRDPWIPTSYFYLLPTLLIQWNRAKTSLAAEVKKEQFGWDIWERETQYKWGIIWALGRMERKRRNTSWALPSSFFEHSNYFSAQITVSLGKNISVYSLTHSSPALPLLPWRN